MENQIIYTDLDRPILFRTTVKDVYVYKSTLCSGSLWLRSAEYYRMLEDKVRSDSLEGVNCSKTAFPLRFQARGGPLLTIQGEGKIGQEIVPHYIMSLHGTSISKEQHQAFGGYTFGVRCISRLASEVLYRASKIAAIVGYRFGQVSYQYSSLAQSHHPIGSAAIGIGGEPLVYINPVSTDVLRKEPIQPFIEQDEWRIVIFVERYVTDDPAEPLKVQVSTDNFYEYIA